MTDRTKEWVYGIIAEASFFGFLALSRNLDERSHFTRLS